MFVKLIMIKNWFINVLDNFVSFQEFSVVQLNTAHARQNSPYITPYHRLAIYAMTKQIIIIKKVGFFNFFSFLPTF